MNIQIRAAAAEDICGIAPLQEQIARVHIAAKPHYFKENASTMSAEAFAVRLSDPKYTKLVAVLDGEIVGYALAWVIEYREHPTYRDFDSFYIDDICVSEAHQRKGIGRALMARCVEKARALGCKNVELGVWSFNTGAISFYESCGMREKIRRMELELEGSI